MAENAGRDGPWLIAAWPGMGNVAVIAAGYLIKELEMIHVAEFTSREHFDVNEVVVKDGLIQPVWLPRGLFFRRSTRHGERDLIVFLGEAQPTAGTYAYAHKLMESASVMGVVRVVTFASMASGLHPAENPKVTGVATDHEALGELRRAEVEPLVDGQIGGLNGMLLAVAAERGVSGLCLLAEIPFFAAAVPNPKAARAALSVFSVLAGIDFSLEELNKHAAAVDRLLIAALEKMKHQSAVEKEPGEADQPAEEAPGEADESAEGTRPPETREEASSPGEPKLDYAARHRIEQLFEQARKDSSKAMALKQELDRLGVFKRYEDRFLDLFRRAE